MNGRKMILMLAGLLITNFILAQNILQDYYKGNKDSMLAEAAKLIAMPDPVFKPSKPTDLNEQALKDLGFEQVYKTEDYYFNVRDNKKIAAYRFPAKSKNTIILIHGVGTNSYMYNKTAGLLREATRAEVFAIDLRGHGRSEGKDGDVDYINQYADDVADIVNEIRKKKPGGKVIIAGHSMGGGVALNVAMQTKNSIADGYILLAPLIGQNSPAIRQAPAPVNDSIEPFMKIHFARIIGLKMFNELNDHSQDSLPVLFLNLPENTAGRKYTYRANMSSAPEDYKEGLKALTVPALVLIGTMDEAFDALAMKKAVNENCAAQVQVINGATHNGIRHNPASFSFIKKWFSAL